MTVWGLRGKIEGWLGTSSRFQTASLSSFKAFRRNRSAAASSDTCSRVRVRERGTEEGRHTHTHVRTRKHAYTHKLSRSCSRVRTVLGAHNSKQKEICACFRRRGWQRIRQSAPKTKNQNLNPTPKPYNLTLHPTLTFSSLRATGRTLVSTFADTFFVDA
jgi:hypothetical protein